MFASLNFDHWQTYAVDLIWGVLLWAAWPLSLLCVGLDDADLTSIHLGGLTDTVQVDGPSHPAVVNGRYAPR